MVSIPRDLRTSLLARLVRAGYVTSQGDKVRLTATGAQLALVSVAPPADPTQNPAPSDREARVRTPRSGGRT